jgi:hypothetical protein
MARIQRGNEEIDAALSRHLIFSTFVVCQLYLHHPIGFGMLGLGGLWTWQDFGRTVMG